MFNKIPWYNEPIYSLNRCMGIYTYDLKEVFKTRFFFEQKYLKLVRILYNISNYFWKFILYDRVASDFAVAFTI